YNWAAAGVDCAGIMGSLGYNLLLDPSGCGLVATTGDLIASPAAPVVPLIDFCADYGGPTKTVGLLPGSPAIDAGDPAGCTDFASMPLTTDQRGSARPID